MATPIRMLRCWVSRGNITDFNVLKILCDMRMPLKERLYHSTATTTTFKSPAPEYIPGTNPALSHTRQHRPLSPAVTYQIVNKLHNKLIRESNTLLSTNNSSCQPKHNLVAARHFQSKRPLEEDSRDRSPYDKSQEHEADHAWMIRLANENGYLSWARNAYIATVAGATMYLQEPLVPCAKEASVVIIMMGFLNLAGGTFSYIYNLLCLRHKMNMSLISLLYQVFMAVIHLILWIGAIALYLGIVEEEPDSKEDHGRRKLNRETEETLRDDV